MTVHSMHVVSTRCHDCTCYHYVACMQRYTNMTTSTYPGTHHTPGGHHAHVYGQGEWFTPCSWDDWPCHVALAKNKASYRRQSKVVGVHHFSGSWLGLDGSRSLSLMNEVGGASRTDSM